jgi:hypothetical protein
MKSRSGARLLDKPMAEHLVASGLSPLQLSVCQFRLSGISNAQIIQALPGIKGNRHISKRLLCAAAGFAWDIEQAAGRHPYPCPIDREALVLMVAHGEHNLIPFMIPGLVKEAQLLKNARNRSAIQILLAYRCIDLLATFRVGEAECPWRSWVNSFCHRARLSLRYAQSLDRARISHSRDHVIRPFYAHFEIFIRMSPAQ